MLIYAYYDGQLDHMFTDQDMDYVHKMCFRLDNPELSEGWEYQTEDSRKITYWKTEEKTYGKPPEQ